MGWARTIGVVMLMAPVLSGCGGPSLSDNQKAEVADIAEDHAEAQAQKHAAAYVEDLEGRVDQLETGTEDLERRLSDMEGAMKRDTSAADASTAVLLKRAGL